MRRDEVAEFEPDVAHLLVAGEGAGVHDHQPREALRVLDREPQADRPAPVVDDGGRVADVELLEQRRHQLDVAVVACTRRGRWACRSGRSRRSRGRCSGSRRRGPAGSPCARGTTRSARRGRRRPAAPPPRRDRRAAARRPRGSSTRRGSRAAPAMASSGVRTTSPALMAAKSIRGQSGSEFPTFPINFVLPCRARFRTKSSQQTKSVKKERNPSMRNARKVTRRRSVTIGPPGRPSRASARRSSPQDAAAATTPPTGSAQLRLRRQHRRRRLLHPGIRLPGIPRAGLRKDPRGQRRQLQQLVRRLRRPEPRGRRRPARLGRPLRPGRRHGTAGRRRPGRRQAGTSSPTTASPRTRSS